VVDDEPESADEPEPEDVATPVVPGPALEEEHLEDPEDHFIADDDARGTTGDRET
jgi:hypothetical protein